MMWRLTANDVYIHGRSFFPYSHWPMGNSSRTRLKTIRSDSHHSPDDGGGDGLWNIGFCPQLTWLVAWEDFIEFSRSESFKSYNTSFINFWKKISSIQQM
jgi:hypothetical protein